LTLKNNRNLWSIDDDITLMLECLKNPKEWAKIARNFHGRTQHQIKNRFIRVLSKELYLKREKISYFIKNNTIAQLINETLKSLKFKKQENNTIFYCGQKDKETESNEINYLTQNGLSFKLKTFEENMFDKIFYQETEEQNLFDFIKFDL